MVRAQPSQCPTWVALDVAAQRVARFTRLANGLDVDLPAAADLAPACTVVPHLTAFDLQADDAGALDADEKSTSWSLRWSVTRWLGIARSPGCSWSSSV